jgi:hypothetical protein
MRFDGEWLQCDDGIVRPIIRAELLTGDDVWRAAELLVDTGSDRTVLSANMLESLHLPSTEPENQLGGLGGLVDAVTVATQIRLTRDDGRKALFLGEYAACMDHEALDMSVMGRDILEMFALIVDRRADVIAIIGGQHHYTIQNR